MVLFTLKVKVPMKKAIPLTLLLIFFQATNAMENSNITCDLSRFQYMDINVVIGENSYAGRLYINFSAINSCGTDYPASFLKPLPIKKNTLKPVTIIFQKAYRKGSIHATEEKEIYLITILHDPSIRFSDLTPLTIIKYYDDKNLESPTTDAPVILADLLDRETSRDKK